VGLAIVRLVTDCASFHFSRKSSPAKHHTRPGSVPCAVFSLFFYANVIVCPCVRAHSKARAVALSVLIQTETLTRARPLADGSFDASDLLSLPRRT